MRRTFGVAIAGLVALIACTSSPVGRICELGTAAPSPSDVVVASPSLDCVSRTCLRVPLSRELPEGSTFPIGNSGLCTAECSSDDDCERVPESPCKTGFTCAVATTVGPFCCRKLCQCKDYIEPLAMRAACDEDNPANTCCNLSGRTGNDAYPQCR
jgi:hypothetical protein